jgi:hypothetical protein
MDSEMKVREFFRISRDIFQSIKFLSNSSLYLMAYIYIQELIQKYKTQHKTTAYRAECKVWTPLPHDAAGPARDV